MGPRRQQETQHDWRTGNQKEAGPRCMQLTSRQGGRQDKEAGQEAGTGRWDRKPDLEGKAEHRTKKQDRNPDREAGTKDKTRNPEGKVVREA